MYFELVRPNCAGIDLGSRSHYVAPPARAEDASVRMFGCFTQDLLEMGAWLLSLGTEDVAMEATGVYWIPVYEALSSMGLRVALIDGRAAKALPGRKTDVQDCQWIRELHSYGLVKPCMVPEGKVLALRSYWRQRHRLVAQRSEQVQLMQKALEQMNVQLHKVLTDIAGVSGQAILRAVVAGERNPETLADLVQKNVKTKRGDLCKALQGTWAPHHVFALSQALDTYDFFGQALQSCDARIDAAIADISGGQASGPKAKPPRGNKLSFASQEGLIASLGVDPTQIDGIDESTAITLLAEFGTDLSAFGNEKRFNSYLRLAPRNQITGGRRKKSRTPSGSTRSGTALKMAAQSLARSQTAFGACYRRLKARVGPQKATTAVARKIATAYYRLLQHGIVYQDPGAQTYEQRFKDQRLQWLTRQAAKLEHVLVPIQT